MPDLSEFVGQFIECPFCSNGETILRIHWADSEVEEERIPCRACRQTKRMFVVPDGAYLVSESKLPGGDLFSRKLKRTGRKS